MKNGFFIRSAIILVASSLWLVGCGGKAERMQKYLQKGIEHFEAENYEKAAIEFKNVLQIEPKTAEPHYYLGQIYEFEKELPKAYSLYKKTVELDPQHRDARAKLVRLHMYIATIRQAQGEKEAAQEEMQSAQQQVDEILKISPADPEALTLQGAIHFRNDDSEAALKQIRQVLKDNVGQPDASAMLALMLQKDGEIKKSIEILQTSYEHNPDNEQILYQLAGAYEGDKQFDKAEALLVKAAERPAAKLNDKIKLVSFYSRREELGRAETMIKELIAQDPQDPQRHKILVGFYASKFGPEKAEQALLESIAQYPKLLELQFGLAQVYEKSKMITKAKEIYQKILDAQGPTTDGITAKSKLATLYFLERDFEQAKVLADEVLAENPRDNDALEVSGKLAMVSGGFEDAVAAFRSILKDKPESANIRTLLAEAHLRTGEVELARDNLESVIEQTPKDVQARLRLIKFLMMSKDHKEALKHINKVLVLDENNIGALLSKAEALAATRDFEASEQALRRILEIDSENIDAFLRLGRLAVIQKQPTDAIKILNTALDKAPSSSLVLTELVRAYVAAGKLDEAEVRLRKVMKNKDNEAPANLLLGELYLARKNPTKAKEYFEQATRLDPAMSRAFLNLAQLYLVQGEFDRSIAVFNAGLNHSPKDVSLFIGLAGAYERQKQHAKAIDVYNRLLEAHPSNVVGINNLASLLVDHGDGAADLTRAKELALRLAANPQPAFMDTVGWVHYHAGEFEKAVRVLEDVVTKAPNIPVFNYHLGMAYFKMGNLVQAKSALQTALDAEDDFHGAEQAKQVLAKIAQS